MKHAGLIVVACCVALLLGLGCPMARANQSNQATKLTFNQPIEIPGRVLAPGTNWFTLLRDDPDRDIVQVWGANRQHLLATILTVPDYRLEATGKTMLRFAERPSNRPEALRARFYPGDDFGHEFVCPESRARDLARRTGHPVLSMRDDEASNITKPARSAQDSSVVAMKKAHVEAINSKGQKVDKSAAIQAAPQKEQVNIAKHQ